MNEGMLQSRSSSIIVLKKKRVSTVPCNVEKETLGRSYSGCMFVRVVGGEQALKKQKAKEMSPTLLDPMKHEETESELEIANETCDLRLNRPRGRAAFTSNSGYETQLRLHVRAHWERIEGVYETESEGDVARWYDAPGEGG